MAEFRTSTFHPRGIIGSRLSLPLYWPNAPRWSLRYRWHVRMYPTKEQD